MSDQPIPTPRHDKLLFEEACNFDVGWSEEYRKLESELDGIGKRFQSLQSERDELKREAVVWQEQLQQALDGKLDNERWQKEVLNDYKVSFDDHVVGRRLAFTQLMFDLREERDQLRKALAIAQKWVDCQTCDFITVEEALNHSKSTTQ